MLTPRQQRGLAALLEAPTIQQAAMKSKISHQCLRRWLASDREFREKYTEAMNALVRDAADSLRKNMSVAIQVMADVMTNESASPQIRLNAADAVMRNGLKFIEMQDILQRLAQIEERINCSDECN